jgi:hypothetical protein
MEHHLKMMLDGKIMTLEVYTYSRHGILQMGPLTYAVAIGSPEWQLRESHSLKKLFYYRVEPYKHNNYMAIDNHT